MNELSSVEEGEISPGHEEMKAVPLSTPTENDTIELDKKKNKLDKTSTENGSIRGVETMFKSSYTTQLALTTLADNKANMMISINGLILSIVIAGSSATLNGNPYLLLPVGILLVSSLTAIFLAIRAARPNVYSSFVPTKEDFFTGKANALFFGHFATLSPNDYFKVVSKIMKSRKLTYQLLSQHTHGLGVGLVRKFKLLQWSYTVFITGLGTSIGLFIVIYLLFNRSPVVEQTNSPVFNEFKLLDSVNESSGITQLLDGRFLVINDEKDHPMDLLTLDDQGQLTAKGLYPEKLFEKNSPGSSFRKLADLEGIDIDNEGYIYAVTSHAYNSKGEKKADRKKLLRFKIEGGQIREPSVVETLEEGIAKKHPFLAKALAETDSKSVRGFNIEGLTLNSAQNKLLLGLRSPLINGKAVIVSFDNTKELFTTPDAVPQVSDAVSLLDLKGDGVRSINYFSLLNGYLIVGGPVGKSDNVHFNLWLWCGDSEAVQPVTVTGLAGFEETEGITPMFWNGQPRIMMITDGTLDNSTAARYIILKYEQLNIKNSCPKK